MRTGVLFDNKAIYISNCQIWCFKKSHFSLAGSAAVVPTLRQDPSCQPGVGPVTAVAFGRCFLAALKGDAVSAGLSPSPSKKGEAK